MYRNILIIFSLVFFVFSSVTQAAEEKTLVEIGVIVPLTGGLAARGDDVVKLIEILEPELNTTSSNYRYKFKVDDGKCGATSAPTTIAKKFIGHDNIKFLITGCSGETLQVGPIAQRQGVVTFAILSTHPDVRKIGDYVFRTFVDIEHSVKRFAEYMSKKSGGKIVLLTEENAFTAGIKNLLEKSLESEIVYSEDYPAETVDFNTILLKVKNKQAGGVYFNALSENTLAILVNQGRALGLKEKFFTYNMPEASTFRKATGKNSDGMAFIGSPVVESSSDDFSKILKEFHEKNPEGPSYEFILRTFFDAAKSIVDAVEAVGPAPVEVKQFLSSYRSKGALGDISYDKNGDIENINYFLWEIVNGENVPLGDLLKVDIEAL